jgi:DNA-binding transcriptional LysR family regulator
MRLTRLRAETRGAAHRSSAVEQPALHRLRLLRATQAHDCQAQATIRAVTTGAARADNFQVCKQYILEGLGIGAMPTQIICTDELRDGGIVPVLPDWKPEPLDVHMIYPFELSFSTLISAFYEAACEIIVENIARS